MRRFTLLQTNPHDYHLLELCAAYRPQKITITVS